jgi:hypothetical protein
LIKFVLHKATEGEDLVVAKDLVEGSRIVRNEKTVTGTVF